VTAERWLLVFAGLAAVSYLAAAVAEIGQLAGWWP
jgi:hypothetical protein